MKFKLDENFGTRTQQIFKDAGHEVQTVIEQKLQGAPDADLFAAICSEDFCLVTLDLDFANVLRYPPQKTYGVVVVRIPQNPSLALLESLIKQLLQMIEERPIKGALWIVEVGRIRVHAADDR